MVAIIKLLVFALTASATPLFHRDVITVQDDITQKIGPQISTLNSDVNAFPASGSAGAQAIEADLEGLVHTLNAAIGHVKSTGSFGTLFGTTILTNIQLLVPALLETLGSMGAQAPSWDSIPDGRTHIFSDLQSLDTAFSNYATAIIAGEPLLLKAGGIAIQIQIGSAFTATIAAYSE